jgi:acetolactate synthase-1/2/3 large subunit
MNIQEMSTAVQYGLPVKVFILNNQYMGMVRQWQELLHGNRLSNSYMESLARLREAGRSLWRPRDPGGEARRAGCDAIEEMIATPGR